MPNELKPCPVCGAKAYISRDNVDGFFFGYSAGCPRYYIDDGIHGIENLEEHKTRGYSVHFCSTKEEAIEKWNKRCDNA